MAIDRERAKRQAAEAALAEVPAGAIIGVGTGSTANYFIDALARQLPRIRGAVASSRATAERLARAGLTVVPLEAVDRLPLYVDGADEATRRRQLIKGGGGALTREKIVAAASERFVCVVDEGKLVERLGAFPLPIEVLPMARRLVASAIERLGGRAVEREGYVTDNGNAILDVHGLALAQPERVEAELNQLAGVVANGLFCIRPADLLLVGTASGVTAFSRGQV